MLVKFFKPAKTTFHSSSMKNLAITHGLESYMHNTGPRGLKLCYILLCIMYACIGQHRSVELQKKIEAVELYNDTMRFKEERALLIVEMNSLLQFYHANILPLLSEDIQGMFVVFLVLFMLLDIHYIIKYIILKLPI